MLLMTKSLYFGLVFVAGNNQGVTRTATFPDDDEDWAPDSGKDPAKFIYINSVYYMTFSIITKFIILQFIKLYFELKSCILYTN